jgi:hypothetical protein
LLTDPRRNYTGTDKFLRGVEKVGVYHGISLEKAAYLLLFDFYSLLSIKKNPKTNHQRDVRTDSAL